MYHARTGEKATPQASLLQRLKTRRAYGLQVEGVARPPNYPWLRTKALVLRLGATFPCASDVWVSLIVTVHAAVRGFDSNLVRYAKGLGNVRRHALGVPQSSWWDPHSVLMSRVPVNARATSVWSASVLVEACSL